MLPPHFPYLPAPPGFAPIKRPGEVPAPAGMAAWDWSSFIHPAPVSTHVEAMSGALPLTLWNVRNFLSVLTLTIRELTVVFRNAYQMGDF